MKLRSSSSIFHLVRAAGLPAAALALSPAISMAQSANSGTVTGTVTDPSGAVVQGATITVADPTSSTTRTATSNKDGLYVMPDVPSGTYNVTATKSGFSQDQIIGLTVSVGEQANANFKLAVGAENTVISVEASNADLQTMNASTGSTVDNALVQSLPAIGRDAATFATLQPGVSPTGQVAGTTADQASFSLDGGNNSSDMDGTQTGYTSGNLNSTVGGALGGGQGAAGVIPTPQDSVEEFKVSTTGQTADFNNSTGSSVQIVTKRGHDQVHGSVYEYYLDNNFNANSWQNNFTGTGYTAKPSYHYSRFGAAAGGPVLPFLLGGKTYLFANYEGFRWPYAQTYERTVPSFAYLQNQSLTFPPTGNTAKTYTAAQLKAADPRAIGMNATMRNYYSTTMPLSPSTNAGSVGATGVTYAGIFDTSCGSLSTTLCDSVNTIGYRANVQTPQSSNFLATRLDHDFGAKWHLNASYRYYNLQQTTTNQVDIGGQLAGDTMGVPKAVTPRPQQPWYLVVGLTTNISSAWTNDFHYSFLRNFWVWKGPGAPAQVSGAGGAIEPLGEYATTVLSGYNVNAQNIRTRTWNGKDNFLRDDLTDLRGNHFIQIGFQFQHNFDYHQRTDNGASINYTPTYQIGDAIGGGTVSYSATGLGSVGAGTSAYARILDTYYGIITDTQVANTYTNNNGTLTLNPALTPIAANTSIPYYNAYVTDTWHPKPTLTINYGVSYAIEMPPSERNGNQILMTDPSGNTIYLDKLLAQRQASAAVGQIYNPIIAFTPVRLADGGNRKYPYNPFFGSVSPRVSAAWNPKFDNDALKRLFGNGDTVLRVGYGRQYGRINGDAQILNPLLSPGLLLGTRCQYLQHTTASANGTCNQSGFTDTTAFRFGATSAGGDGLTPLTASATPPSTLPEPYRPGLDGPGVSIASPLDPSLRPNDVDTFNVSIQRQLNKKMLVEVGYIGRLIHHEYIMKNPNQIPYNLVLGGQSFVAAYDAVEKALNCNVSQALCSSTVLPSAIASQPFLEAALGGSSSTYCTGYTSCTMAFATKQLSNLRAQKLFTLWQALDNNTNGAAGAGWTFNRSLMGTTLATGNGTTNATYGSAGQLVTGASIGTPDGYSNYHGGYVSFKVSGWHGLTAQENLTFSKALGLGAYNQSTSSQAAEDNYNLSQQYGVQSFDQRLIFNTFLVYETPWYKSQAGLVGRLAGGWTISPVIVAGTGQPEVCTTNNSGQNFGGNDGNTFTDSENCIFTSGVSHQMHTYRGITGGADALGASIGTATKGSGSAAVNVFTNPAYEWDGVRAPILGLDARDGGSGSITGLGYVNMDMSIRKALRVYGRFNMEFSGTFFNVLNHLDFTNPSLSLQSPTAFGVTKTQGNTPRQMQAGARVSF